MPPAGAHFRGLRAFVAKVVSEVGLRTAAPLLFRLHKVTKNKEIILVRDKRYLSDIGRYHGNVIAKSTLVV